MQKILIGAAFKAEIAGVAERLQSLPGATIDYFITGMGLDHVRHGLLERIRNGYDLILNIGTAGAFKDELAPLTVFYPSSFCAVTGSGIRKINLKYKLLREIKKQALDWKEGMLFSSVEKVDSADDRFLLRECLGADAVDMEAFAYAEICRRYRTPFYCLKIITDRADAETWNDFKTHLPAASWELAENVPVLIDIISEKLQMKLEKKHG